MRRAILFLSLALLFPLHVHAADEPAKHPAYDDPSKTDEDFEFQGEYQAEFQTDDGPVKYGLQIIALGKGQFEAVAYKGGLPGDGWNRETPTRTKGTRSGEEVTFNSDEGRGVLRDGVLTAYNKEGTAVGKLQHIERKSPTLGEKPPEGAVVLFDGSNADQWEGGQLTKDGLLMAGTTSKQKFQSHKVHIEFRLPYQPEDREQARGNSGIYLQGRYEVQMLDSFGLKGENNECGGIYTVKAPDVNMCLPPLAWQTYDIDYTAAKYEGDKIVSKPRITVKHNGVVIHDDVELPTDSNTRGAPVALGPDPGPIYLQDHGNPVRYRNIWVVEK